MKYIALLLFIGFITISFWSLPLAMHGSDGLMKNDCPFSAVETTLCLGNALTLAFHHISAYQSFFSAPVSSNVTILIISLLLAAWAILTLFVNQLLFNRRAFIIRSYNAPPVSLDRKLSRWLSLLENSPSM